MAHPSGLACLPAPFPKPTFGHRGRAGPPVCPGPALAGPRLTPGPQGSYRSPSGTRLAPLRQGKPRLIMISLCTKEARPDNRTSELKLEHRKPELDLA